MMEEKAKAAQRELEFKTQDEETTKYSSRDVRGLAVKHDVNEFEEGKTILTLKDQRILKGDFDGEENDEEDILENVHLVEKQKRYPHTRRHHSLTNSLN
jgi:hypothetical protein